jgi:GMP synthase-like glutamine amidotransferase
MLRSMRVHCVQHVPFEGLGSMDGWLQARRYSITYSRMFAWDTLLEMDAFDLLIVMGGPMSVNDEQRFSWLGYEKRFIAQAINHDKYVLGICLGAQLIASALDATVRKNPQPEIGWFPVDTVPHQHGHLPGKDLPQSFDAFHWHGETFYLPAGETHLFRSAACQNQGFAYKTRVLGLQFHLETTPSSAQALIDHYRHDIVPSQYIQSEKEMLASSDRFDSANRKMAVILDQWLRLESPNM